MQVIKESFNQLKEGLISVSEFVLLVHSEGYHVSSFDLLDNKLVLVDGNDKFIDVYPKKYFLNESGARMVGTISTHKDKELIPRSDKFSTCGLGESCFSIPSEGTFDRSNI